MSHPPGDGNRATGADEVIDQTLGHRLLPRRIHYGWWITIGIAALMFGTLGVGYYGLAVFLRPLQEENGWSNTAVSGATGLYFTVSGITGFFLGPLVDRHGPRRFLIAGVLLVGLAAIALGSVSTLLGLYVVYIVQAVAFGLAGTVGINSIMARWFVTRRAKAMSISATGISLGGIVLSPVGSWLVGQGGVALAAPTLGILVLVVGMPIVLFVLVWDPSDVGEKPDFGRPDPSADAIAMSDDVQLRVWTRAEAARTVAFWAILVGFVLVLMAQTGFLLHQIAFLEDRFNSREAAALTLSTTAFGSVVARLIVGQVADRLDKVWLSAGLFTVQGLSVLGVLAVENRVITFLFVLIIGFTIGNIYLMQTLLVAEKFGLVSLGTVLGVVGLAVQVGSGAGPLLVGWLEDRSGGYTLPFILSAATTLLSAVVIMAAKAPIGDPQTSEQPSLNWVADGSQP
ncbi:MAG: MFS transporter [Actinomycetota bacterium]